MACARTRSCVAHTGEGRGAQPGLINAAELINQFTFPVEFLSTDTIMALLHFKPFL